MGQVEKALALEVQQAAGGCNQNVEPPADGVCLGLLPHPAEDDGPAQGQPLAVGVKALADLDGQLPGGGEDQGADHPGLGGGGAQPLEDRGGEGTGLASAGLGAAQHIPPGQGRGDGLFLNGGGGGILRVAQGGQNGLGQAQVTKLHKLNTSFA